MDNQTLALIATGVLSVLSVLGILAKGLKYVRAVKESLDVVIAAVVALSDGKVSADEIAEIQAEIEEAKAAWKA